MDPYRIFKSRISSVQRVQPDLKIVTLSPEHCEFVGVYHLQALGERLAGFRIRFTIGRDYTSEPIVHLVERYFPFHVDRHIYDTGECCICIWEHWVFRHGYDIDVFLSIAVRDFFLSQIYCDEKGEFRFEWEHGAPGVFKAFAEILAVPNSSARVRRRLEKLVNGRVRSNSVTPSFAMKLLQKINAVEGVTEKIASRRYEDSVREQVSTGVRLNQSMRQRLFNSVSGCGIARNEV